MKLWLDDIRPAPDGFVWARTAEEAIAHLATGEVTLASLDHDLGNEGQVHLTGYDVLSWMERAVAEGAWYGPPPTILVHSANPVGRKRMEAAAASIRRLWEQR